MTTIAIPHLQADEQFKAYLLKILAEDMAFAVQVRTVLRTRKPKTVVPLSKTVVPFAEMPYWKLTFAGRSTISASRLNGSVRNLIYFLTNS
jgi:hypothetical protein